MDTLKHLVSWARRWWVVVLLGGSALAIAAPSDDPPGRVGRLADLQGSVYWFDHEQGQWSEAERNLRCFAEHCLPELKKWEVEPLAEPADLLSGAR